MVYVLNKEGKPLMPTQRHGKVRRMLKEKKARVVKREPFTIQLLYETTDFTQDITLGVDAGSKHSGLSASNEKKELYSSDVELREDIVKNLSKRQELRRNRRNRKTRYRKARFQNRVRSKKKGWLAPSIEQKIDCHLKQIKDVCSILPVKKIIVEAASFDIQKINDPDIEGEQYQQGEQLGFWNVREYVLSRDGHECQHCRGKSKDPILNVHHIESRKTGGDAPNNLITLCKSCHKEYHSLSKEDQSKWSLKRGKPFKDGTFMNSMRWTFYNRLKELYPNVSMTYGYITKNRRIIQGLAKEHYNDAYCIAGNLKAEPLDKVFFLKKARCHNRKLHDELPRKGQKRRSMSKTYVMNGFRLRDKVLFEGQECFVTARRTSGSMTLKAFDGKMVKGGITYKKLKLIKVGGGYTATSKERTLMDPFKKGGQSSVSSI